MVTFRVPVSPKLLTWAADRSGRTRGELERRFPQLNSWESGAREPTFRQLEDFAQATFTPFGTFFLAEPPVDELPIPDFRTIGNQEILDPSPDLLETIFLCERRQEWYRQYAISKGIDPVPFIGSATIESPVVETAQVIRETLQFTAEDRAKDRTWADSLRRLIDTTEDAGILVMVSGIVADNTRRFDPAEFRGFVLSDPLAPLIFINTADTKAAQIFTLVHEVSHLWLGQSAVPAASMEIQDSRSNAIELWCHQVTAEVLVPLENIRGDYRGTSKFEELDTAFTKQRQQNDGGNDYNVQPSRVSRRFARALIDDTLRGRTLHHEAFRLLGTRKHETFVELG